MTIPVIYDLATDSMRPVTQADVDRLSCIETLFGQLCEETDFLIKTAQQVARAQHYAPGSYTDIGLVKKFLGNRAMLREQRMQAFKESPAARQMEFGNN